MSTSRSRHSGRVASARSPKRNSGRRARPAAKRPVDPSAHSLPGTALHRLALIVGEASRGLNRPRDGEDPYLHLRNPVRVAEELKQRVISLGSIVQKRVAAKIAPSLSAPRALPLGLVALLVGVVLVATQRYWALAFMVYGALALVLNSVSRRRFHGKLLAAIEEAITPDLQLLSSDRTRAEAISGRFADTRNLDFLESDEVPASVPLPQGERVLLSAGRVLKARETKGGLLREAEGKLLVTNARLLFLVGDHLSDMELNRVVRADVIDEIRLVVIPSKREAPGNYIALGNAHALAEVIRLAKKDLPA